jgi:type 1 fimbria pilin
MYMQMMKASLAIALTATAGVASAAIDPHSLAVEGTISTPTCTVSSDKDGVYDYGKVNGSLIPPTGTLALSMQEQRWTVDCGTGKTFLAFQVVDNRDGTASQINSSSFGLGAIRGHEGSKIGYFTVTLANATLDQTAVNVLKGTKGAATGTGYTAPLLEKNISHGWTKASTSAVSAEGSVFAMDMRVNTYLANEKDRGAPVVEGTPLDGSLTLNYSFGL